MPAAGDGELDALALLLGLASADRQPQAGRDLADIVDVEPHPLGAAQSAGEAQQEQGAIAQP